MNPDQIKMLIGDLIIQQYMLNARVAELEAKLAAHAAEQAAQKPSASDKPRVVS